MTLTVFCSLMKLSFSIPKRSCVRGVLFWFCGGQSHLFYIFSPNVFNTLKGSVIETFTASKSRGKFLFKRPTGLKNMEELV